MALSGAPDTRVRAFPYLKPQRPGFGGGVKKKKKPRLQPVRGGGSCAWDTLLGKYYCGWEIYFLCPLSALCGASLHFEATQFGLSAAVPPSFLVVLYEKIG